MKKFISSLAIASIALVGLLSSCTIEDIQTTFNPASAQATITVTVINSITGENITSASKIEGSSALLGADVQTSGSQVILTGNKSIVKQDITVSASCTYNGKDYKDSKVVSINELPAGGKASYAATILLGIPTEYSYSELSRKNKEVPATFKPKHGESLNHQGYVWAQNETPFLLKTDVEYTDKAGVMGTEEVKFNDGISNEEKLQVEKFAEQLGVNTVIEKSEKLPLEISGYAMYTVKAAHSYDSVEYGVFHDAITKVGKVQIGTIIVKEVSTVASYSEQALPGHEGHYIFGHGQKDIHGFSSNAGGGIVWAD